MTLMPASSSCSTSSHRLRCARRARWCARARRRSRLRPARDHRVDVHLLERDAAVLDLLRAHDLEIADLRLRLGASVRLDEADDDVDAASAQVVRLVEHPVRLTRSGRRPDVDLELPALALSHERKKVRGARRGITRCSASFLRRQISGHISTCAPSSTTRFGFKPKNADIGVAFRSITPNNRSRHNAIPGLPDGMTVSRLR